MGSSQSQNEIYDDAADLGRVYATIGLVIAIILGIILLGVSLYLIFGKNVHTDMVMAQITTISCGAPRIINNNTTRECSTTLTFNYNGKDYSVTNFSYTYSGNADPNTMIGTSMKLFVDPNNPIDVSTISKSTDKIMGLVLLGISILLVGGSILHWWLARRYKFMAAAEGAGAGIGAIRGVFNRAF